MILKVLFHWQPEKPVLVDVSGPHRAPPPNQPTQLNTSLPVIHIERAPVEADFDKPTPLPPKQSDQAHVTADLMPNRPIVLYISRNDTGPDAPVLKLLPSLQALNDNELYTITRGNEDSLFSLHDRKGVASLKFTRTMQEATVRLLSIQCMPIHDGTQLTSHIKLSPFSIELELHIL